MAQQKRIYSSSVLTSMLAQINEDVSFSHIHIRISGVAGAAAPALSDVGRIQYVKNGVVLIDAGFDALSALTNVIGGVPNTTAVALGAVDFSVMIPRRWNDRNVERVTPKDNAQIRCTFGAGLAANIASAGLVEVYLDLESGVNKYDLSIRQFSESITAASVRPVSYDSPNILFAAVSATVATVFTLTGSNITQVQTKVGDQSGDSSLGALQDYTNGKYKLETATALLGVVYEAQGDITSRLNDTISLQFTTSGASTTETLVCSALFDNNRLNLTAQTQVLKLRDQLAGKAERNDGNTIAVVRKLQGTQQNVTVV